MAFILKSEENELFLIRSIRMSLFPFSCVFNTINDRLNIRLDLQKHEFIIYVTDDMICYWFKLNANVTDSSQMQ